MLCAVQTELIEMRSRIYKIFKLQLISHIDITRLNYVEYVYLVEKYVSYILHILLFGLFRAQVTEISSFLLFFFNMPRWKFIFVLLFSLLFFPDVILYIFSSKRAENQAIFPFNTCIKFRLCFIFSKKKEKWIKWKWFLLFSDRHHPHSISNW